MEFWAHYGREIELLMVYTGGILAYTLLVAGCYTFLSRRDMFGAKKNPDAVHNLAVGFGYVAIFPLMSFAFFLLLSGSFLFFLKTGQSGDLTAQEIFTRSMAIVAVVRGLAYIHEATAHEVAKLMPLGLLGIFLVFNDFTTLTASFQALGAVIDEIDLVGVFFGIVVLSEFMMRGLYLMGRAIGRSSRKRTPASRPVAAGKPGVAFRKS